MQRSAINCQDCGFSQLCLPFSLSEQELSRLDDIIQRKRPLHKGDMLFESNTPLKALFAIRSGSFKTFTLTEQGEQQITGFHLPGDVIGFDPIIVSCIAAMLKHWKPAWFVKSPIPIWSCFWINCQNYASN